MPDTFTLHDIAAGVWAAIAPGTAGPAVSNAAIVDLGDATLVVDTFMTEAAAQELATEARRLTGRAAHLVVNSHWHSDHVGGNAMFAAAPIVGTERMRELIVADGYQDALPDVLIGDRLDVVGSERSATVLGYGRGHTESDLFVHLPHDDVLIAGDLVWNGMHPKANDGFPADWATVIDRMAELGAKAVAPGHGPPATPGDVSAMACYLRELDRLVAAVRAGDADPETAEPPAGSEDWDGIARFRKSLELLAG